MNSLKADEYRRGISETNALSRVYTDALGPDGTIDRKKLFSGAAANGLGARIPELQKGFLETDEKTFKIAKERYDLFRTTLGALKDDPNLSKQTVTDAGRALVQHGLLPAAMYESALQNMPEDPAQLRQRLTDGLRAQMSPEKIFELFAPKPEKIDNGGQISFRDANPNSPTYGQATGGPAVAKVATPGELLRSQDQSAARAQAERHFQAGQNAPQYMDTDAGLIALPKKLAPGQVPAGTMVTGPDGRPLGKSVKAPPGYRYKQDGSLEAIPGGPADIKAGEAGAKAEAKRQSTIEAANSVLKEITEAKGMVGPFTAGIGGVAKSVPGTSARNLDAKLTSIKANLGFDRLQQMRDQSPTGGALGQVAVQELVALQSTVASLDQLQSPKQLSTALDKIEKHYTNWLNVVKKAGASTEGAASGGWKIEKVN